MNRIGTIRGKGVLTEQGECELVHEYIINSSYCVSTERRSYSLKVDKDCILKWSDGHI